MTFYRQSDLILIDESTLNRAQLNLDAHWDGIVNLQAFGVFKEVCSISLRRHMQEFVLCREVVLSRPYIENHPATLECEYSVDAGFLFIF